MKTEDNRFVYGKQFPRVMKKILKALRGYKWAMIGGRSVEVWANPPQTPDIDCLVKFQAKDAGKVISAMSAGGFELTRKVVEKKYAPMFFFMDTEEHTEVDLLGAFEDVHDWAIDRSVMKTIGGVKFPVAQPEDIVILKANAALTPNRGEKVVRDIAAIKAIDESVDLDIDYIEIVLSQATMDWSDERELLVESGVLDK